MDTMLATAALSAGLVDRREANAKPSAAATGKYSPVGHEPGPVPGHRRASAANDARPAGSERPAPPCRTSSIAMGNVRIPAVTTATTASAPPRARLVSGSGVTPAARAATPAA